MRPVIKPAMFKNVIMVYINFLMTNTQKKMLANDNDDNDNDNDNDNDSDVRIVRGLDMHATDVQTEPV